MRINADLLILNILRSLVVACIMAIAGVLWSMNSQLATLDERIKNVLARSDKNDAFMEHKLGEIERHLNELRGRP